MAEMAEMAEIAILINSGKRRNVRSGEFVFAFLREKVAKKAYNSQAPPIDGWPSTERAGALDLRLRSRPHQLGEGAGAGTSVVPGSVVESGGGVGGTGGVMAGGGVIAGGELALAEVSDSLDGLSPFFTGNLLVLQNELDDLSTGLLIDDILGMDTIGRLLLESISKIVIHEACSVEFHEGVKKLSSLDFTITITVGVDAGSELHTCGVPVLRLMSGSSVSVRIVGGSGASSVVLDLDGHGGGGKDSGEESFHCVFVFVCFLLQDAFNY
jgi:hypothetical protein